MVTLEVSDDGVGFRVDADKSRGLGLDILRCRAALIDATLDIRSTEGKGTQVICLLPLGSTQL